MSESRRPRAAAVVMTCLGVSGVLVLPAAAGIVDDPVAHSAPDASIALAPIGTYETGIFDEGASEIVSYDAGSQRLFVINAAAAIVEVLDVSDPRAPERLFDLPTAGTPSADQSVVPEDGVANSVDVRADGLGAVAVEAPNRTDNGWVVFFDARSDDGAALGAVRVGALPDMVTFTPDGSQLLVANEGEPAEDYSVDPEGSVSVIAVGSDVEAPAQDDVATADFHEFEVGGSLDLPDGVRIYGGREDAGTGTPEFPVSENLEPEYIAVVGDLAYVTLQEANAIGVVGLETATVTEIRALGLKDHSQPGNELDPSDEDGGIDIASWPVFGLYQPDGIQSFSAGGQDYLVTANEGDTRDWEGYSEVARVKDLGEDGLLPVCEGSVDLASSLGDEALGRLNITTADGLNDEGTCYAELHSNGGRSFSIWDNDGELVFDSGAQLEEIVAAAVPDFFNSNHSESNLEGRSDDKGPEPEGVELGTVGDRTYAFVGLERVSGVMVFDITAPDAVEYVAYVNNRNFAVSVEDGGALADAGDLGPEGLEFVAADESPIPGTALLVVGNEVSGSTTFYRVDDLTAEPTPTPSPTPTDEPTSEPTGEPSPAPTVEPSPGPGDDGGSADGSDDGDQPLPDTGANSVTAAVAALALLALGAGVAVARRRVA